MSKARQLADLGNVYDDGALSNRNVIINGNFSVWQRGTSLSGETGNKYLADRWLMLDSGGTYNASQEDMALEDSTVPNFIKHYLEFEATTGNNNMGVYQRIEDVQTLPSGKVVISFYAKGTNPNSGDVELFFRQNFGSGGSTQTTEVVDSFVLTSSWQRFTFVHDVPSLSGKTIGSSSYVQIGFRQPDGDSSTDAWTLDITGVQLEVGDTATPFEHRSYGDELARCQRYFQALGGTNTNDVFASGFTGTGNFFGYGKLNRTMRSAPSASVNGTNSDVGYTHASVAASANSAPGFTTNPDSFFINIPSSTTTTNNAGSYARITSTSTQLYFDAEL